MDRKSRYNPANRLQRKRKSTRIAEHALKIRVFSTENDGEPQKQKAAKISQKTSRNNRKTSKTTKNSKPAIKSETLPSSTTIFYCDMCDFMYINPEPLAEHKLIEHGILPNAEQMHACLYCHDSYFNGLNMLHLACSLNIL